MLQLLKNREVILILLILFMLAGAIYAATTFFVFGPGLPPAEGMPQWYLPDMGRSEENTSLFPPVSEYSASGNYPNSTFICVWYFKKESSFLEGEEMLLSHLKEAGHIENIEIDITSELDKVIARRGKNWSPTNGPRVFNATKFEGSKSSGYFIVYRTPLLESREDYFIVYYGTKDTINFNDKKNDLMYLIARSYYLSEGNVTALEENQKEKNGFLDHISFLTDI